MAHDPLDAEYMVTNKIFGRGQYGKVVAGWRRNSGTQCALKYKRSADTVEEEALRKCQHPNLIRLLDAYPPFLPSRPEFVLVFPAADTDLSCFLARRAGNVPVIFSSRIAEQVAQALAYLHRSRFLHRDLKPANILLTYRFDEDGSSYWHVDVADLGMVRRIHGGRLLRKTNLATPELMTAQVCTVWYRAPELFFLDPCDDEAMYSSAIDVWSFGQVVYELLAGHPMCRSVTDQGMVDCLVSVLGVPPATQLWAQTSIFQTWIKAFKATDRRKPLPPLASLQTTDPWWVAATALQWDPSSRTQVEQILATSEWLKTGKAVSSVVPSVAGSDLATPQVASQSRMDAWLESLSMPPAPRAITVAKESAVCGCTGHCYQPGHRYRRGCVSCFRVVGSTRCEDCMCTFCLRPRYHGDLCSADARILSSASIELQWVRQARAFLHKLMPDDITDWLQRYNSSAHDVALLIVLALVKEPCAVSLLMEELVKHEHSLEDLVSADKLHNAYLAMLNRLGGVPTHKVEMEQLSRQGVARFMGSLSVGRNFGIIEVAKTEAEVRAQTELTLGLMQRKYVTGNAVSADLKTLVGRANSSMFAGEIVDDESLRACCDSVRNELVDLGKHVPALQTKSEGYVLDWICRKFVLAALSHNHSKLHWEHVSLQTLRQACADQRCTLDTVPPHWNAKTLSEFFTGRADWAMLVSMFACLFGEAASAWPDRVDEMKQALCSGEFEAALDEFKKTNGRTPCPMVVFQQLPMFQNMNQTRRKRKQEDHKTTKK